MCPCSSGCFGPRLDLCRSLNHTLDISKAWNHPNSGLKDHMIRTSSLFLLQTRSLRRLFFLSALLSTKVAVGIRNVPTSAHHVRPFLQMVCFRYGASLNYGNWATVSFRNCPKENLLEYNACDVLYCALYATGDEWLASHFSCNFSFFNFYQLARI